SEGGRYVDNEGAEIREVTYQNQMVNNTKFALCRDGFCSPPSGGSQYECWCCFLKNRNDICYREEQKCVDNCHTPATVS
ncbi:hypothetical protein U1Q18_000071, partial [Sarracenia purpurea var. burkii]